jgi:4-nitrophenyl phosphatase
MPYRLYILDMDGTLFRGKRPFPEAIEAVSRMMQSGALVRYVTNNSGETRDEHARKLTQMGFPADAQDVFGSGDAAAQLCLERHWRKVFVVGEPGLVFTFRRAGCEVTNADADGSVRSSEGECDALVAGICRRFDYALLASAMKRALSCGVLVATNKDAAYPVEDGGLEPGAGAIVSAIAACSGIEPIVAGKPDPRLIEMILAQTGCAASEALVVGDRMDTDIEAGRRCGCDTHLVLSGVTHTAPPGQRASESLLGALER